LGGTKVVNFERINMAVAACARYTDEELRSGLVPSLRPNAQWLHRAIRTFLMDLHLPMGDDLEWICANLAQHILGNWLMVEQYTVEAMRGALRRVEQQRWDMLDADTKSLIIKALYEVEK
jgi:hypothetical protein